jgi:hypothetical protein
MRLRSRTAGKLGAVVEMLHAATLVHGVFDGIEAGHSAPNSSQIAPGRF